MIKEYDFIVDTYFSPNHSQTNTIAFSDSDINSIQFNFTIQSYGTNINLTDTTVRLGIKKPSSLIASQVCTITDAMNGKCEALLLTTSYDEIGKYEGELYLDELDGSTIVTSRINFVVQPAIL